MIFQIYFWNLGGFLLVPTIVSTLSSTAWLVKGGDCFSWLWYLGYDKKSDEGSNSVRMRPENSGALKVVKKWLSTRVSDSSDAQLSDYV